MNKVCDYCDAQYEDTLQNCPHCGAPNDFVRRSNGVPTTIEELQQWYSERGLPPYATTRFFIGVNTTEPRAFGIYRKDNGDVVVYKNKNDSTRAIRYEGGDEAYGVNEIYTKLKEQMNLQMSNHTGSTTSPRPATNNKSSKSKLIKYLIIAAVLLGFVIYGFILDGKSGYYTVNNKNYYNQNGNWYSYGSSGWYPISGAPDVDGDIGDYYQGNDYSSGSDYSDFADSDYYSSSSGSSGSDSNWDSDWDSGDWDSGGMDFDSDWLIRMPQIK